MTAPGFRAARRPARATRPPLPHLSDVLLEQVRVTGLALRMPALLAAALLGMLALWVAIQYATDRGPITINAWPTQLPGVIGALLPIAVWARDERFGPGFLWTLPVDRRQHAFAKVVAGWVWLMAGIALFLLWMLAVTSATGGRALPPETLYLATSQAAAAGPLDPGALRTVRWSPGLLLWLVPFTAATACYLLGSAVALGTRHPLRWVIGSVVTYVLASIASQTVSRHLDVAWLDYAPERLLRLVVDSRYGLDAVLTARIELLSATVKLTTGEHARVWWAVPDLADWRTATLLWIGVGLLALWAAASRHREGRRA